MRKILFLTFLISLGIFSRVEAGTFISNTSGNWGTSSTWTYSDDADGVPDSDDNVTISSGHTVTMNGNSGACGDLTINGTANWAQARTTNVGGNLTLSGTISGSSTGTLNVTGNLSVPSGATASIGRNTLDITGTTDISGTLAFSSATGTKTFTGLVTVSGTWSNSVNEGISFDGGLTTSGTFSSGTGTQTITGDLTGSGGSATFSGSTSVSNNLSIASGATLATSNTLAISGASDISGTLNVTSTTGTKTFGNLTINSAGTMNFTAAESITSNGDLQVDGTLSGTQGTWTFQKSGGGGTLSGSASSVTLTNATFTTSYTNSVNLTVTGTLTVTGATIRLTNNSTLTVNTALSGTGGVTQGTDATLNIGGTSGITTLTATNSGNTVNYNRAGAQTIKATTYHHLALSGSGTKTAGGALTINGNLTIGSGITFAGGASAHTAKGNWTNNGGTFTSTGTVTFNNPDADQEINGTAATQTFYRLAIANTGRTLSLSGSLATLTVSSTFTLSAGTFSPGTKNLTVTGAFTVSGGTFSGGAGNLDLNSTFTLSSGAFTAPSGTIYCANTFTISGGTFTHNSGTLVFDTNSFTINPGSATCYNVTFNGAGRTYTITNNTTITVSGTLNLTDGYINQTTVPAAGTIAARGNITQYSTFDGTTAANTTLVIDGSTAQTFTGSATATAGDLLRVDIKPTGTLTFSGTIRTGRNWTWTSGTVDEGTSTVVFGIRALTVSGSMEFYNLTFNTAATYTIAANTTLTVNGTLTLTDGTINAANLTTSKIYVAGDINVAATADNGTTPITLTGTTEQRITATGTAPGGHMNNTLNINNSSGIVTITGNVRLHNVNLQAGTLTFLGGATYTIDDADAITTSSGTSINFSGSSGSLVTLRSDTTAQWDLTVNAGASYSAEYVDVQYSNANAGRQIVAYNSVNSGNNTNWSFPSQLVFTTTTQNIIQNTASGVITVQLQTGSGTGVNVPANARVNLSTTSSTGLFSSSSGFGDTITYVTILAGSSSASFYYKDSTAGIYTITASESPSQGWTDATQTITVESKGTWRYKVPITITSGTTLTDYQVLTTVNTQALISVSKMNSTGSDIRFYDSDDITSLSYWVEDGQTLSTATAARIWVKVPSLTAPTKTVYLYYGNSSATSASNITNTFIFGDDFSASPINTSKWDTSLAGAVFSVAALSGQNCLRGTNTGTAATGRLQSQDYFTAPFVLEASVTFNGSVNNIAVNGVQTLGTFATTTDGFGVLAYRGGNPSRYYYRNNNAWVGPYNTGSLFINWHTERITVSSTTGTNNAQVYLTGSGVTDTRTATNSISTERITLGKRYDNGSASQAYSGYWNWIVVRKYAATAPAISLGTEAKNITKLNFTTVAQTLVQNQASSLITVQAQGYDDTPANVSVDTTISLSSSSSGGTFSLDGSTWSTTLNATILAGQNSTSFYYKDSEVGAPTLTAAESPDVGWTDATQIETVNSSVNTFLVSASSPQTAGLSFTLTITAKDENGETSTSFSGTANLTANYISPASGSGTLSVASTSSFINGVATITNQAFSDCGTITITATKSDDATKAGTSTNILFLPYDFNVSANATTQTVNKPFTLTVTARNAQGATCPNYEGTANLSVVYVLPSTDQSGTITPSSLGSADFTNGISATTTAKYDKWGSIKIRASDSTNTTRSGESQEIMFCPKDFSVTLSNPPQSRAFYYKNEQFTVTVTARDQDNIAVTNYAGTIELSSSNRSTTVTYIFLPADSGIHNFIVSFSAAGKITLTAKDTTYTTITGQSGEFEVKEARIRVVPISGPVGNLAVRIEILDAQDSVISEDDSTTFTVTLTEGTDNDSTTCDTVNNPVTIKSGVATIQLRNFEAESVIITPASSPVLTPVAGTVTFGSFKGRGIGVDMWREIR